MPSRFRCEGCGTAFRKFRLSQILILIFLLGMCFLIILAAVLTVFGEN